MECWTTLTENNLQRVLFILDAYGVLRVGKFVVVAYGDREKVAVLSKDSLDKVIKNFDKFNKVIIRFDCDEELAELLDLHMQLIA